MSIQNLNVSTGLLNLKHLETTARLPPSKSLGLVEKIKSTALPIFEKLDPFLKTIKQVLVLKNFVQIVLLPYKGYLFIKNCISFPRQDRQKQIDAGLQVCQDLKEIGEASASFVVALQEVKAIPELSIAGPFGFVLSALSIASVISHIRTCIKVNHLKHRLNAADESGRLNGKMTYESYKALLIVIEDEQIKDQKFIKKTFNTSQESLTEILTNIDIKISEKMASKNQEEVNEGQLLIEKVIGGLKGRVKQNIVSSALSITSSVINIIGTVLLLTLPFLPVGWALLGVKTLIDGSRFIHHKVVEYKFAKAIDLQRTKLEWITC